MEFAKYLQNYVYKEELEDHFPNKCAHLRAHLKHIYKMSILQLLCKWLKEYGLYEIYTDKDIVIRIFVCIPTPAANCSTERPFSCL